MSSDSDSHGIRFRLFHRIAAMSSMPGRVVALAILVVMVGVRIADPQIVEDVRLRGFDFLQQLSPLSYEPSPVRIVAIDEKSLARYGQWPWPRDLVGRLVQQIAAGRPAALGVDLLFVEPDRMSPSQIARNMPELPAPVRDVLAHMPTHEAALADAFRAVPTVLGIGATFEATTARGPLRSTMIRQVGGDPRPYLLHYPALVRSLDEITAAERGRGALVGDADRDGVVRRVPLFVVAEGHLLPSLALETLRVALHLRSVSVVSTNTGVAGATLGDRFVPTDRHGRAYPHFTPSFDIRYVSAADLLDGAVDPASLHGYLVLLGVTGLGLTDVKLTPLGAMQGVEVHAQLIESMFHGTLLSRPGVARHVELALIVALGLVTILAIPYGRPRPAAAIFVGLVGMMAIVEFGTFRVSGLLVDFSYPAAAAILVFGTMLTASLRAAEASRRHLAAALQRERESRARVDGELDAARAIQMGLLPRRLPGPPHDPGLDVFASIEPARSVGGDFYDVERMDERRLFFAIADVSGKGVPAALFMAMSKEVLGAAIPRHATDVGEAVAEANARICRTGEEMAQEGADMMFVTLFAGILDCVTGAVDFVCAGHDAPFLLAATGGASAVSAQGGPPLGMIDGFPYPVEHCRLMPGDALVLFTDGVTEAESPDGAFYSGSRLGALIGAASATDGAAALVARIRDDVAGFVAGGEPSDDVTLLAIRWLGPPA